MAEQRVRPAILHMFSTAKNMSPFDINMAVDAGFDHVIPYGNVTLDEITGLTQDAIFSRGPKGVRRTALFIGGREIGMAADMIDAAREAMVPPFEVSVFADPSGAFTTAAAMVAVVDKALRQTFATDWKGKTVTVVGGTGPVGACAAVLAARSGATVTVMSHSSLARAQQTAREIEARYQASGITASAPAGADERIAVLAASEVILACSKAGVQVVSPAELKACTKLRVAADVNAVPPAGIAGVGVMDSGKPVPGAAGDAIGFGALAIGNVKYMVQQRLLESMLTATRPMYLDFRDAFEAAKGLA